MVSKQAVDDLIFAEFQNPTGSLGNIIDDYGQSEGQDPLGGAEIDVFNAWEYDITPTTWKELVKWFWSKVRDLINWLKDLL
jgi:hypothetical protein